MPSETSNWIVSVPVQEEKGHEQMFQDLVSQLVRDGACEQTDVAPIRMPPLKTGTLESLIVMAEDLPKIDTIFAAILARIVDALRALLNDDEDAMNENMNIDGMSVEDYIMSWKWNSGKYRVEKSLNDLIELFTKEMQTIDHIMKQKLTAYNTAKGQLQQLERKKHGNLTVCSLADIVHKDDMVDANSEFLTTLLVVVPKTQVKDWLAKYERLTPMVVPRSSAQLAQDEDYVLYNVTLFKKVQEEFMQKARENKFHIREFVWDEGLLARERAELEQAGASEKELWSELLRLSCVNFAEAFQSLFHFKIVRTFVESVLRFGLPATYFVAVVEPTPRKAKAIIKSLVRQFDYLNEYISSQETKPADASTQQNETPGEFVNLLEQEVFPFVLTEQPMITV